MTNIIPGDLKSENIMVWMHNKSRINYMFNDDTSNEVSSLTLSSDDCPFEIFLNDFGLCQYIGEQTIRPNKQFRPLLNVILEKEDLEEWETCDLWSVGLLLIEITLTGWTLPVSSGIT